MKEEYSKSKKQNLIGRYINMQRMIYNLIQVERQYWQMYDIPTQAISETPFDYVIRDTDTLARATLARPYWRDHIGAGHFGARPLWRPDTLAPEDFYLFSS
uniref:Uncharacterized protein n=1 Tax=Meloidogyne javanica TaxID=6303 RepID=A0A915M9K4_MELJA